MNALNSILNNILFIVNKFIAKDEFQNLYNKKDENSLSLDLKKNKILKNFKKIPVHQILEFNLEINKILNKLNKNETSVYVNNIASDFFSENDPLLKIALDEKILNLVQNYFQERAILWDLRVLKSENNHKLKISHDQLWHRDKYDSKSLRLWVSLSDCYKESGPFQYLPYNISKKITKSFFTRIKDDYLVKKNLFQHIKYLHSKKGEISLIDVSDLLHCGSRTKAGKTRLVFNAIYTTSKPYKKPTFNSLLKKKLLKTQLSDLQKSFLTY